MGSSLCVISVRTSGWRVCSACSPGGGNNLQRLNGSQVRLTRGFKTPGVIDLLYTDDGGRLQPWNHIFIISGEAQLHWRLTPCHDPVSIRIASSKTAPSAGPPRSS